MTTLSIPALVARDRAQLLAVARAEQARRVGNLDEQAKAERDPAKQREARARRDDVLHAWAEIARFIDEGVPPEFIEPACAFAAETARAADRRLSGIPVADPALPQLLGLTVIGRLMAEAFPDGRTVTPPATYLAARAPIPALEQAA